MDSNGHVQKKGRSLQPSMPDGERIVEGSQRSFFGMAVGIWTIGCLLYLRTQLSRTEDPRVRQLYGRGSHLLLIALLFAQPLSETSLGRIYGCISAGLNVTEQMNLLISMVGCDPCCAADANYRTMSEISGRALGAAIFRCT